ncbi:cilia- and flagella-associated protein 161-like [Condylostylus longicornis]|uniref:cilia- and flagella-associated protein 161-like n=1 Tax=Condylostylus longicornis TaxID=2530218 RepID=UPI00244DB4CA|nr:cilia- and flagella-associated protein 161-like [Condylostylus longicornis]
MEIPETKYSCNVRIGNWYEDLCLEEMMQKIKLVKENFCRDVELSAYSPIVNFGIPLQLLASTMKTCNNSKTLDNIQPALSININPKLINKQQNIGDKCELTVASSLKPCTRNSFVIESADNYDRSNKPLLYNQDFKIRCCFAEGQPLYVYSVSKSVNLDFLINNTVDTYNYRGERNLPVGLILDKNTGPGKLIPDGYTKWKCLHVDPSKRLRTEGTPVPSNTPVLIVHSATNRSLAVENVIISTLFGAEYAVSVQVDHNLNHRQRDNNIWILGYGQIKEES